MKTATGPGPDPQRPRGPRLADPPPGQPMNDGFFDRVITGALDRSVPQFVLVGGADTGQALRQARPGVGEPAEGLEHDAGRPRL